MSSKKNYDVVVLGSGPGGYVAAIHGAHLGLKVAVVEKAKLGGVCLNSGCIPSKSFLKSAELFHNIKHSEDFGITTESVSLDMKKVQLRKNKVIEQLSSGIDYLLKKNKIDVYYGKGRMLGPSIFSPLPGSISVDKEDGSDPIVLVPKNVIVATGSRPIELKGIEFDGANILDSTTALNMDTLPKSMIIVGGGVIGVEWASMLSDFGVEVTILEQASRILALEDEEISKELTRLFKKRKIKILTSVKVQEAKKEDDATIVELADGTKLAADKVLVSIGRVPNSDDIGIDNTDIKINKGILEVNQFMQTAESHIYAIGDVVGGFQLAHVASHEGLLAIDHIAGNSPLPLEENSVPRCIYTRPEIGSIGISETQARDKGHNIKIGKFSFKGLGKALVKGETDGFMKVISDEDTDDILGVHIIGPNATDMISEASLAKFLNASGWELSKVIRPHPTLSEIYTEAASALVDKPIHS